MGVALDTPLNHTGCPLYGKRLDAVPSFRYGKAWHRLYILLEAPGKNEDEACEPMVGSAGKIGRKLLADAGLTSYVFGNTIRCRPPENRTPEAGEIAACLPHAMREISEIKPDVVLAMGGIAGQSLLRGHGSVASMRGWTEKDIMGHRCWVYVTYHPSVLHYDPNKLSPLQDDLALVSRKLSGAVTEGPSFKLRIIRSKSQLDEAIRDTMTWKGLIGRDWETPGLDRVNVHPLCLGWGTRTKNGIVVYVYPWEHPETPFSADEHETAKRKLSRLFREISASKRAVLGAHNAKFDSCIDQDVLDLHVSRTYCSMHGVHAIDENRLAAGRGGGIYSLEATSLSLLGVGGDYWDDAVSHKLYSGRGAQVEFPKLADHCARDIATHLELAHETKRRAQAQDYEKSFKTLRVLLDREPYLLATIERNGMPVDLDYLAKLRQPDSPIVAQQESILHKLHKMPSVQEAIKRVRSSKGQLPLIAGDYGTFEPSKRKFLSTLFFDVLNLEQERETPTGLKAIDREFYEANAGVDECAAIQLWAQLAKLRSTYLDSWWQFVRESPDRRIRASFNGVGTITGRLACSDPNLQFIPKGKTKEAKIIKKVFRSLRPGYVILVADFSQAELRWLAEYSGDKAMTQIFVDRAAALKEYARQPTKELLEKIKKDLDLHRRTAASMYNKAIREVTDEDRQAAKAINFGVGYGQTKYGLAAKLHIDEDEAEDKLESWLDGFPGARDFFIATEKFALAHGWVQSLIGRRRHLLALLLNIASGARNHLLRVARNAPVQSIASDINLWVAIKFLEYICDGKKPWYLLGLIHDSILAEVPLDDAMEFIAVLSELAEDPDLLAPFGLGKLHVPMEMEFSLGPTYGDQVELTAASSEQRVVIEKVREMLAA